MWNINGKQVSVGIISALSFIAAGTAQMEPLFGKNAAATIASAAAFFGGLIGVILAPYIGNSAVVRDAASIQGARVVVGPSAPQAIAALAVSEDEPHIQPEKGQEAAVAKAAQGV